MNQFKEQLDSIVGKTFSYKNENIIITKYKDVNGTNVVVFCNDRPKNFLYSEIQTFLSDLRDPFDKVSFSPAISIPTQEITTFQPTKDNQTLKETLMETLEKVKKDPKYIPQAHAVCNVVAQMVNIQKEELKMIQILRK
jgi:hypothetical protein